MGVPDYCDLFRCARVDADRALGSHWLDTNDSLTYGALLVDEPDLARLGVDPAERVVLVAAIYNIFYARLLDGVCNPVTCLVPEGTPASTDDVELWLGPGESEDDEMLADPDLELALGAVVASDLREHGGKVFALPVLDSEAWGRWSERWQHRVPSPGALGMLNAKRNAFVIGRRVVPIVPEQEAEWRAIADATGYESPGELVGALLSLPVSTVSAPSTPLAYAAPIQCASWGAASEGFAPDWVQRPERGWKLLKRGSSVDWREMVAALQELSENRPVKPHAVEMATNAAFNLSPHEAYERLMLWLQPEAMRAAKPAFTRAILDTIEKRVAGGKYLGNVLQGERFPAVERVDSRWGERLRELGSHPEHLAWAQRVFLLMAPRTTK